jgi:transposase
VPSGILRDRSAGPVQDVALYTDLLDGARKLLVPLPARATQVLEAALAACVLGSVFKDRRMVDHGGVMRRHELTDQEWELLAPLIPQAATGRPRVEDRLVVNGMVYKIRTGISWRDLPDRYGSWQTVYTRFRRYALDGVFTRALQQIQAHADAAGDIDWLVQIDSTIVRAHQHAAATGRNGDPPAGRTRRSRPRPIPRRPEHQNPSRLRRQGPPARAPADARPTPRQHLRTSPPGTDPGPADRTWTSPLHTRPGHRGQGLQLPRIPRLPA